MHQREVCPRVAERPGREQRLPDHQANVDRTIDVDWGAGPSLIGGHAPARRACCVIKDQMYRLGTIEPRDPG